MWMFVWHKVKKNLIYWYCYFFILHFNYPSVLLWTDVVTRVHTVTRSSPPPTRLVSNVPARGTEVHELHDIVYTRDWAHTERNTRVIVLINTFFHWLSQWQLWPTHLENIYFSFLTVCLLLAPIWSKKNLFVKFCFQF